MLTEGFGGRAPARISHSVSGNADAPETGFYWCVPSPPKMILAQHSYN